MSFKFQYINREKSWLAFNERVLQEAADVTTPLLERIKFLGIFSSNRDEFYKVRIASIKKLVQLKKIDESGQNPVELLQELQNKVIEQQLKFETIFQNLLADLEKEHIYLLNETQYNDDQKAFVKHYFETHINSNLFPIIINQNQPFPYLKDKSGYLFIKLVNKDNLNKVSYSLIELPLSTCSRIIELPAIGNDKKHFSLIDDVIRFNIDNIFARIDLKAIEIINIKLTRDAEIQINKQVSLNLIKEIANSIQKRKEGLPVRFVYDKNIKPETLAFLLLKLGMSQKDSAIPGGRYHNFKDFINFPKVNNSKLYYQPINPIIHKQFNSIRQSLLNVLEQQDILLHFPYHSFDHIISLLKEAAISPYVESIKITLYRISSTSKVANALINAMRNNKKVTVLIELKARFDEANNIHWANKLKEEGATVIYGVSNLKVHSKMFLITAKKNNTTTHYGYIGTGNFNENTSVIYSDLALLTTNTNITKDILSVFNYYTNTKLRPKLNHLLIAPYTLRQTLIELIDKEIINAKTQKLAYIILKMNSLVDVTMIKKLYEASQAGVQITLMIRGICCLVAGVKGLSENIKAYSIIDKYLEHARVFIFCNNDNEKIYLASADWMERNLDFRSEIAVPIFNNEIKKQIRTIINIQLSGNSRVRIIDALQQNDYKQKTETESLFRVQDETYNYLKQLNS